MPLASVQLVQCILSMHHCHRNNDGESCITPTETREKEKEYIGRAAEFLNAVVPELRPMVKYNPRSKFPQYLRLVAYFSTIVHDDIVVP